jgi:Ca2+-binding EF-hand superfamily protein
MRRWVLTAAAALTMAVGAPVVAQQPASEQPQQAERIQKRRALRNRMQARWQRLDKDGNGSISRGEWPRRPEAFDRLDTNKDGVLTRDELAARRATRRR